jgi:hypothetical protein
MNNNQAFSRLIFARTEWQEEMAKLGFTTLFIGSDLESFARLVEAQLSGT